MGLLPRGDQSLGAAPPSLPRCRTTPPRAPPLRPVPAPQVVAAFKILTSDPQVQQPRPARGPAARPASLACLLRPWLQCAGASAGAAALVLSPAMPALASGNHGTRWQLAVHPMLAPRSTAGRLPHWLLRLWIGSRMSVAPSPCCGGTLNLLAYSQPQRPRLTPGRGSWRLLALDALLPCASLPARPQPPPLLTPLQSPPTHPPAHPPPRPPRRSRPSWSTSLAASCAATSSPLASSTPPSRRAAACGR